MIWGELNELITYVPNEHPQCCKKSPSSLHCPAGQGKGAPKESDPAAHWKRRSTGKREQWSPLRGCCRFFPMTFQCKMPKQLWEQEPGLHGLHTSPVQLAREQYAFSWRQQKLEHCLESLNARGLWNNLHKCMIFLSFCEKGAGIYLERDGFYPFLKPWSQWYILWKRELQECRRSCSLWVVFSLLYVELSY